MKKIIILMALLSIVILSGCKKDIEDQRIYEEFYLNHTSDIVDVEAANIQHYCEVSSWDDPYEIKLSKLLGVDDVVCEWKTEIKKIYGKKLQEYTCPTTRFNFSEDPYVGLMAFCYNETPSINGTHATIWSQDIEYGDEKNKTAYWYINTKLSDQEIQICNKIISFKVDGVLVYCE